MTRMSWWCGSALPSRPDPLRLLQLRDLLNVNPQSSSSRLEFGKGFRFDLSDALRCNTERLRNDIEGRAVRMRGDNLQRTTRLTCDHHDRAPAILAEIAMRIAWSVCPIDNPKMLFTCQMRTRHRGQVRTRCPRFRYVRSWFPVSRDPAWQRIPPYLALAARATRSMLSHRMTTRARAASCHFSRRSRSVRERQRAARPRPLCHRSRGTSRAPRA